jgi:hypothetical protein
MDVPENPNLFVSFAIFCSKFCGEADRLWLIATSLAKPA